MIIVFWNFFLIKLSTCSMDPETAVTCMMELEEKKRGRSYYLTRSRFLFFFEMYHTLAVEASTQLFVTVSIY